MRDDILALQRSLNMAGASLNEDGLWGARTCEATMDRMTKGPDTPITPLDVERAADLLAVSPAQVWAVYDVESTGKPFMDGRPTILFEGHRFSKATGGRFDKAHPDISYPQWDRRKYPGSQTGRYRQLMLAVSLDVEAGFASASYGGFQILGENARVCGFASAMDFAFSEAFSEGNQLSAFVAFVHRNGLDRYLRAYEWAEFARHYNGSAFRENKYDERLKAAYDRRVRNGG